MKKIRVECTGKNIDMVFFTTQRRQLITLKTIRMLSQHENGTGGFNVKIINQE